MKQKQTDLHIDQLSLVQDVTKLWYSLYYMLSGLLQQRQPLFAALIEMKKLIYCIVMQNIHRWKHFYKFFTEITETLGGEN